MLVLATIGELMFAAHGRDWLRSGRLKVRFRAPARPGDAVTASVTSEKRDGQRIEYGIQCTNENGDVLIDGRAAVQLEGDRPRSSNAGNE
jgi:acyl-CoA thioesterase FadM